MRRKNVAGLIAIVVIASVAIFAGCVEEPPSAPTVTPTQKTELSLGESAILDDIEFTVVRFEESHMYECNTTPKETVYSADGAKFLWVYVKAKNVGEVAREVPDTFFNIKMLYKGEEINSQGIRGSAFWGDPVGRKMYHDYEKVYPNVTEEGWILFEVPEGIDLSQAKIWVGYPRISHYPVDIYENIMTWSLAP
mgnify:CR=1 FL=1